MTIRKVSIVLLAAATSVVSLAALASPPPQCSGGQARKGYSQGYSYQRSFLQFVWKKSFDCNNLEAFVQVITGPKPVSTSWSSFLQCRNIGIVDATYEVIDERTLQCGFECFDNGAMIGGQQASVYCGLPSWAPQYSSLDLCDYSSVVGCQSELRTRVSSLCPVRAAADPGFETFVKVACNLSI